MRSPRDLNSVAGPPGSEFAGAGCCSPGLRGMQNTPVSSLQIRRKTSQGREKKRQKNQNRDRESRVRNLKP